MVGLLVVTTTACGYQSSYVPPDVDHYRVVWQRNKLAIVGPATIEHCVADQIISRPPGVSPYTHAVPPPVLPWWALDDDDNDNDHDDGDDGDGIEGGGPLAVIVTAVVISTAVAGTALGLALAPAGRPRNNASTLTTARMHNVQLRSAREGCLATDYDPTPVSP